MLTFSHLYAEIERLTFFPLTQEQEQRDTAVGLVCVNQCKTSLEYEFPTHVPSFHHQSWEKPQADLI